jgi:hypothetical protein
MLHVTELAYGPITASGRLSTWAEEPSVVRDSLRSDSNPGRTPPYCAAKIMRVVARASIELAGIKASRWL